MEWTETLPESIREWDEVKNSKDAEGFWKQMTDMRSHLGQSIRIPSAEAGEDDVKAFHTKLMEKVPGLIPTPDTKNEDMMKSLFKKLGQPETPDKYTIPEMDTGGIDVDHTMTEAFKAIAHANGLSQTQFSNIVKAITKGNLESTAKLLESQKVDRVGLKSEWGVAFDDNMATAALAAEITGAPKQLVDAMKASNVDSGTAKWLHGLATRLAGEGGSLKDLKSNTEHKLTPSEAQRQINEIRNNPDHDYHHATRPGSKAAREYMSSLYRMKTAT